MVRIQGNSSLAVDKCMHQQQIIAATVASGALQSGHNSKVKIIEAEDGQSRQHPPISPQQAQAAWEPIVNTVPNAPTKTPSIEALTGTDPMVLSMMLTGLVLSVSTNTSNAICQQLKRATDLQTMLRDKRVEAYQEQINKSVEQAEEVRKAGMTNAIFDWIISGVEVVIGEAKMVEGLATGNVLDIADGAAYLAAGVAGMVKAGAETAMVLGADKKGCQSVIQASGTAQTSLEFVALGLDIFQAGRSINAARTITSVTEKVLESGLGKEILDAAARGAEKELDVLAKKVGEEVSRILGNDFGMAVEREMVEIGDMAIEATERRLQASANMLRDMGRSFTVDGVKAMVTEAVRTATKGLAKEILSGTEKIVEKQIQEAILKELGWNIVGTVLRDSANESMMAVRAVAGGSKQIMSGVVEWQAAKLRKAVEQLMVQQGFIDFIESWTEDRKKVQHKQLEQAYHNGGDAVKSSTDFIDNYGSVLAKVAGGFA